MTALAMIDRIVRPAPIGLRFRDVANGQIVTGGLDVTVASIRNSARRARLEVNGKGVWFVHRFPGFSDETLAATADWTTLAQPCRVTVEDRDGRFLPLSVELHLPARGIVNWPGWAVLPQASLEPFTESDGVHPPVVMRDALPLFSAAGRPAPAPLAEVRCQLVRNDTGQPASWALLTATCAGRVRALGQADAEGRVVLFFAYPERPRASLATSPPTITDFRWSIELTACWNGLEPTAFPEFGAAMSQLLHPRRLFASTAAPVKTLPAQQLNFGRQLILRTARTPDGPSSYLIMSAS